ncbi:hypothetical protein [Nocardia aurea]|uniref:Uncharacterized protein n=1 Tax=Nocardia aurea TaxID=2144174 RepID=A0ABV3FWG5_9NOCA
MRSRSSASAITCGSNAATRPGHPTACWTALQLDEAELAHLFDLTRAAGPAPSRHRRPKAAAGVTATVQRMLDAIAGAPA